eukprot:gene19212-27214_t
MTHHFEGRIANRTIALWGLAFKPDTDDMRDAPSIAIVQALLDVGAEVVAYDPEGMELAATMMPGVTMAKSAYDAVTGADAVVLVTEWDAFRGIDLDRVGQLVNSRVMVDLRNVYNPAEVRAAGWHYSSVGRNWAQSRPMPTPSAAQNKAALAAQLHRCVLTISVRQQWRCAALD